MIPNHLLLFFLMLVGSSNRPPAVLDLITKEAQRRQLTTVERMPELWIIPIAHTYIHHTEKQNKAKKYSTSTIITAICMQYILLLLYIYACIFLISTYKRKLFIITGFRITRNERALLFFCCIHISRSETWPLMAKLRTTNEIFLLCVLWYVCHSVFF